VRTETRTCSTRDVAFAFLLFFKCFLPRSRVRRRGTVFVRLCFLSPMHSGKLYWTELFSSVSPCALNLRRGATTGDDRRRFLTVKNLWRSSPIVAARRRFSAKRKLNWTQLNSTEPVKLSSVHCSAVHWALVFDLVRLRENGYSCRRKTFRIDRQLLIDHA